MEQKTNLQHWITILRSVLFNLILGAEQSYLKDDMANYLRKNINTILDNFFERYDVLDLILLYQLPEIKKDKIYFVDSDISYTLKDNKMILKNLHDYIVYETKGVYGDEYNKVSDQLVAQIKNDIIQNLESLINSNIYDV